MESILVLEFSKAHTCLRLYDFNLTLDYLCLFDTGNFFLIAEVHFVDANSA